MAVRGAKALEVWARRVTEGYPGVRVTNMSTAWKDGLAFCAIVHRFRPDLISFHSLDPADIERNCELIFRLAEEELGIPSLLDPVDMASCGSPDRLSILTYLSEFYHKFKAEKSPAHSPSPGRGGGNLRRKDSCDSGVSVSPLGSLCNSPPGSRKDTASLPPSSFSSSLSSSTSSSAGSSSTSLHPPPHSTQSSLLRASSLPPSLPLSTPSTRASSLPPSASTLLPPRHLPQSSPSTPATSSFLSTTSTRASSLPPSASTRLLSHSPSSSPSSPASSSSLSTSSTRVSSLPPPTTSCLPVITIEREEEGSLRGADRPKLPSASEPSVGPDVALPSAAPDVLSEGMTKSSHVDGKVETSNCEPRLKGDVLCEEASLKKPKLVESPRENQFQISKSKLSTLRATLSSPALPLYAHSAAPNSNGSQKLGWTSPLRSAASPRTGSGAGWASLRPAASPGSEQRRSMLASMICDREDELGEGKDSFEETKGEEDEKIGGKEKEEIKGKEDVGTITEEKTVKAREEISNGGERKERQLNLESVKQEGGGSLCIMSSASEIESSKSAAGPTPRPAFLTLSSSTSTTPTSFNQSTGSTVTGCPMFKSSPSAEEGVKTQSCRVSPNIVSEMALRNSKENIVPAKSENDSRGTSPSAPRQSRSIAELSEALKLSLAPPSSFSSSKPADSLKSRRYSAPPTNYSNLPSSPLSSPQTDRSFSLLKPSSHHLSKSMQQFCLKASPLSASATTEEHQQPSSLASSSTLRTSSLQQQPSSLQMLRKQDDQSPFSSKNTFTLKAPSLQPSSRFVSKTTISLVEGEVAPSPPILYSPNNSVTCGVRPSPGGVRVAIGSSSDGVGGGAGGAGAGGPRLGPRPWASCKGEVRLVENTAAGVSTIKISPPSPSSSTHSSSTAAARVNIGSFGSSANKQDLPLLSLPSLQPETKAEALGFSF